MPAFSIRLARLDERHSLEELQRRASLENPGDREAMLAHPEVIELPDAQLAAGQVFVAVSADLHIGFSVLLPRDDGDVELDGLFVEPGLWRSGVGRGLVEHAMGEAKARGAKAIHVVGNPHAEGFYEAVGFVTIGTTDTRFGPALLMQLPIG